MGIPRVDRRGRAPWIPLGSDGFIRAIELAEDVGALKVSLGVFRIDLDCALCFLKSWREIQVIEPVDSGKRDVGLRNRIVKRDCLLRGSIHRGIALLGSS